MTQIVKRDGVGPLMSVQPFARQSRLKNGGEVGRTHLREKQTDRDVQTQPTKTTREEQLKHRVASLEAEVERLLEDAQEAAMRFEETRSSAYESGKADGLASADEVASQQIAQLTAGIDEALAAFGKKSEQIEILALQIGKIALEKVLEPGEDDTRRLAAIIKKQVGAFKESKPLGIYVSDKDFRDEIALQELLSANNPVSIQIDRSLPQGACRLQLEQGEVEIGVSGQMERLSRQLEQLALNREARPTADCEAALDGAGVT